MTDFGRDSIRYFLYLLACCLGILIIGAVTSECAHAQTGYTQKHTSQDSTGATVTWRKVLVPNLSLTYCGIYNFGTVDAFCALNDDTTGANVKRIYHGYHYTFPAPLKNVPYLWLKCASSTAAVTIFFDYP